MKNGLCVGLILLFFLSCTSPKSTTKEFLEAMNASEFETAMSLVTEDSQGILYSLINAQTQGIPKVNIEVKECAELGNDSMGCIYVISNDSGESFQKIMNLIKEGNEWKIDLTQE